METQNEDSVLRTKRCLFAVTEEEEQERRQREAEEDGTLALIDPGKGGRLRIQRLRVRIPLGVDPQFSISQYFNKEI